jgi:hypothetical protein
MRMKTMARSDQTRKNATTYITNAFAGTLRPSDDWTMSPKEAGGELS